MTGASPIRPTALAGVRQVVVIAGRDLRATWLSPFGAGATAGFVALSGVLLVFDLDGGQARLDPWFAWLFILVGLLAALVTTRSFADEERTGTLELLITAPVSTRQIVLGKLLGALTIVLFVTAASVVCPVLVATMASPDIGPIVTGYAGLVLVGAAFVSVGLLVSASTSSPLVAAAGTAAALVGLWFGALVGHGLSGRPRAVLDYASPQTHVTGFLRGTIAPTDVAYFLTVVILGVVATAVVVDGRR
ncbi:MAG: ABC transporter permease [Acidimicrobiales bacterium]